jgi:hypothetical protein
MSFFFCLFLFCFYFDFFVPIPEIVELDLLNLTPITTTPSSNQTITNTPTMLNHSTNSTNSPTNVSCESPALSITSVQSQPVVAVLKKESNLRSWFTSGSNAAAATSIVSSTSSTPSAVANKNSVTINQPQPMNSQQYNDLNEQISSPGSHSQLSSVSSTVQSTKSRFNFGDILNYSQHHNINNSHNNQQHDAITIVQQQKNQKHHNQQQEQQQGPTKEHQQQKSSRRTTSLLNLFMSNSQGKDIISHKKKIKLLILIIILIYFIFLSLNLCQYLCKFNIHF